MRKNKGDITYYLNFDSDGYHFVKKIKCYSKNITEEKKKTTKKILSAFSFELVNFNSIDFTTDGLRPSDKEIIVMMIKEIEGGKHDN